MYDANQLEWCNKYIQMLRTIELEKFNDISAKVFEFMDVHTKRTPAEMNARMNEVQKRGSKGDETRHETIKMVAEERDILFGIWANVRSRNHYSIDIPFGRFIA